MCIGRTAVILSGFVFAGDGVNCTKRQNTYYTSTKARKLLGLTDLEASNLFCHDGMFWPKPYNHRFARAKLQKTKARIAAEMLRALAAGTCQL